MRKLLATLVLLLVLLTTSCDNVWVGGALNVTTVTGTVSIVQLSVGGDGVQFTFVTLLLTSGSTDLRLCGNHVSQFPMNSTVQVQFTSGTPCNNTVAVIIV